MEKEKVTLQQKLNKRKVKIPGRIPFAAYQFLAILPFFSGKYHPHFEVIDSPKDCKGACFVIWNHQSRRDYLFVKRCTSPRRFNMVAGHTEFFRSHLALLFKLVNCIPKKPFYDLDLPGTKAMTKIIKKGGCIAFSPEGTSSIFGDNQPITPGSARFIRHFKIPVYCMDLRGSYLSSNKVDITDRPGKVEAKMYLLFTPEQLEKMTDQEVEDKINEVFHHDDYVWNKTARIKYKGNGHITSNLSHINYKCPKCGSEFEMVDEGNKIYCKHCGNGATMDDYYDFHPFNRDCIIPISPSEWSHWERQEVIKEIRKNPEYKFTRHVKIGGIPTDHTLKNYKLSEIEGEGDFTIDHEGVHFVGTRNNEHYEFHLNYQECYCPCVEDDLKALTFYPQGITTDMYFTDGCGGKVVLLVQEMHRLHVNRWKNFPWFDYMYESLDEPSRLETAPYND